MPQTKESRLIYETMLSLIAEQLGDQTQEVLSDVANEVLALLKLEDIKAEDKKKEMEAIFPVREAVFTKLLNLSKEIKDYTIGMRKKTDEQEMFNIETLNIAEDEEENQQFDEYVNDAEGEIQEEIEEEDLEERQESEQQNMDIEFDQTFDLSEIDGFWITKQLEKIFADPAELRRKEEQILLALNLDNEIECQNRLVEMFDQVHFDFVRAIHENRHEIYYITKLSRSNEDEKKRIIDDMRATESGRAVLEKIKHMEELFGKQKDSLSMNLMKEAQTLRKLAQENKKEKEKLQNMLDNDEYAKLSKTILNLNELEFSLGPHFMSNENCKLPKGSTKSSFNGYEEVYIPPNSQSKKNVVLKKVSDMPAWAQPAFDGVKSLNVIQSVVYECALKSAENMLICAPTGAGKTYISLLTILQQIGSYMDDKGRVDLSKFKIVYIAPMKALVSEIVGSFSRRLQSSILSPRLRLKSARDDGRHAAEQGRDRRDQYHRSDT